MLPLADSCPAALADSCPAEPAVETAVATLRETLGRREATNSTFSVGAMAGAGGASDVAHWDDEFLKLVGPELYRRPLLGVATAEEMVEETRTARSCLQTAGSARHPRHRRCM